MKASVSARNTESELLALLPYLFGLYLPVYLIGLWASIDLVALRHVFWLLHAAIAAGIVRLAWQRRRQVRCGSPSDIAFWLGLFLLFWLPGAYLEFPSDPWAHFHRLFQFQSLSRLREHDSPFKFPYFWGWTLMGKIAIPWRSLALDTYSAAWQLLLGAQFYRVSRKLGYSPLWAKLQVMGSVFLFGTNLFSFRYYALSSTPLAYAAHLEWICVCLDWKKLSLGQKSWRVPTLLAIEALSHPAEILYSTIIGLSIASVRLWQGASPTHRKSLGRAAGAIAVIALALGAFARWRWPSIYLGAVPRQLIDISWLGSYRLWHPPLEYAQTYGLAGALALAGAPWIACRKPFLAAMLLAPTLVLMFPPTALALSRYVPYNTVYRMLYAFPLSFGLVELGRGLCLRIGRRCGLGWKGRTAVATLLLVLFAYPSRPPLRGRLRFALLTSPPLRSLRHLEPLAVELAARDPKLIRCLAFVDFPTDFYLRAQFGGPPPSFFRTMPERPFENVRDTAELEKRLLSTNACGLLVADISKVPVVKGSWVGVTSGHWASWVADIRSYTPPGMSAIAHGLKASGWTEESLPPFYLLYRPPPAPPHG